jgi:tetratricopeptide (TPR) repeat protein
LTPDADLGGKLTGKKLQRIFASIAVVEDPRLVGDRVLAAVDGGRLEDTDLTSFALAVAADLIAVSGDIEAAMPVAERARAADPHGLATQAHYGICLMQSGCPEQAVSAFERLRAHFVEHPLLAEQVIESLVVGGCVETAHEWLTQALDGLIHHLEPAVDAEEDRLAAAATLAALRRDIRVELGLCPDEIDKIVDTLVNEIAVAAAAYAWMFWPQAEFSELRRRWPALADDLGSTWEVHRADLEHHLVALAKASGRALWVVPGRVAELADLSIEPDRETLGEYGNILQDSPDVRSWPPAAHELCWCGSGQRYRSCCRAREWPE